MIPSVSNISLPAYNHTADLAKLYQFGYRGVEVAPSRVWNDTWKGLSGKDVKRYRTEIEAAGLQVVGLHSLVFDHPELQLFGDSGSVSETLAFMIHLSSVCRDLGGRTLIWGGGRKRGDVPADTAFKRTVDFVQRLCERTSDHGTVFCFEPLGPSDSDFINSVDESIDLVHSVGYENLKVQIDAKALVENGELALDTFERAANLLVHFHANEPKLDVLGRSGTIDHEKIGIYLAKIGYTGYVSVEQRMFSEEDYLQDAQQSLQHLMQNYDIGY